MNLVNLLEFVTFFIGLLVIKRIHSHFLFMVLIIVGYAVFNEIFAYSYSLHYKKSNMLFYIVYAVISFVLLFSAFKTILKGKPVNNVINFFIIMAVGLFCWEIIQRSGTTRYPSNTIALCCMLIIYLCLLGLLQLLKDDSINDLKYESKFWFLTGCIFFHFFLLTYTFIHDYISNPEVLSFNKNFITVANSIFYPFTCIAFLCQLKRQK